MPRVRRINRRRPRMTRRKRTVRRNKIARQVHKYKRIVNMGTYTASQSPATGTVPARGAFSFNMNLLPNVSEYSALYDQYKISGVSLKFIPKTNQFQGGTSGTPNTIGYGQIVTAIDYDDAVTPITKDQLLEFGSSKVTRSNKEHKRYLKPKMLQEIYINSSTTGRAPISAKWIDWSFPNAEHYGIKWFIDAPVVPTPATDSSSISYDVYAVFYFMCKNTR